MNTFHITPQQVRARVARRERLHFLDCRSGEAWSLARTQLPGAVHGGAAPSDRGAAVVLYGASGWEADTHAVAARLRAEGHEQVRILAGGFAAWQALGLPVEPRAA